MTEMLKLYQFENKQICGTYTIIIKAHTIDVTTTISEIFFISM